MELFRQLFRWHKPKYDLVMPLEPTNERMYSTKEVAEALGVTRQRVEALRKTGRLPGQQIGREWVFKESDIDKVRIRIAGPKGWQKNRADST